MIITIILLLISILLEGIIPNLLRCITPFFVISVILLGGINNNDSKTFYLTCFIFGVIYDLLYTNTIFLHGFIYLFFAWLSSVILPKKSNFLKVFGYYLLFMVTYVLLLILFTFLYKSYSVINIIHILYDGLFINTIFFLFVYLTYFVINCIFKNRLKKHSY